MASVLGVLASRVSTHSTESLQSVQSSWAAMKVVQPFAIEGSSHLRIPYSRITGIGKGLSTTIQRSKQWFHSFTGKKHYNVLKIQT
jgi:hypothetical protein